MAVLASSVAVMSFTRELAASRAAVSAATASALAFSAVSILSQLSLNSSTRMRSVPAQRDSVLTHAVTHEQKKRGGNSGTGSTCG